MCRINLTSLLDGGDFCHTAEKEQQISTLLWGVTVVNALQDAQVWSGIQLLGAGGLLLRGNRLVYHLEIMGNFESAFQNYELSVQVPFFNNMSFAFNLTIYISSISFLANLPV